MAVVGLFVRQRLRASPRIVSMFALWGAAYPVLLRALLVPLEQVVDVESVLIPAVGLLYLVAFPALAMLAHMAVKPHAEPHAL
jgi:hypothetical protein